MSSSQQAVLHLVCGSHYARQHYSQQHGAQQPHPASRQIARRYKAELLYQADWQTLCEPKEQQAIEKQVLEKIAQGHSVVLDIPANTPQLRQQLKVLIDKIGSRHLLHYLVSSAPLHKKALREHDESQKNSVFIPPKVEEGFNVEVSPYSGMA